jgi:ribose transport system permease protein
MMHTLTRLSNKLKKSQALGAYIMLFLLVLINLLIQGKSFANISSINSLFLVNTPLILATIAQAVMIFSGGIDLSIGATISVVNAFAVVAGQFVPVPVAWAGAFLIAVLLGVVKGSIVAYLRVPAILVTFAISTLLEGVALLILPKPGGTVPSSIYSVYGGIFAGFIPISALVIAIVLIGYAIINRHPLGAQIKAAGANQRSLFIAGVNVERTKLKAYLVAGVITGIAGLCLTALASSGDPKIGNNLSLNTIAAAILGGVNLSGGWGTTGGAAAGALFLGVVNNLIFFVFNNVIHSSTFAGIKLSYLQQLLTNTIVILGLSSSLLAYLKKGQKRRKQVNETENNG